MCKVQDLCHIFCLRSLSFFISSLCWFSWLYFQDLTSVSLASLYLFCLLVFSGFYGILNRKVFFLGWLWFIRELLTYVLVIFVGLPPPNSFLKLCLVYTRLASNSLDSWRWPWTLDPLILLPKCEVIGMHYHIGFMQCLGSNSGPCAC